MKPMKKIVSKNKMMASNSAYIIRWIFHKTLQSGPHVKECLSVRFLKFIVKATEVKHDLWTTVTLIFTSMFFMFEHKPERILKFERHRWFGFPLNDYQHCAISMQMNSLLGKNRCTWYNSRASLEELSGTVICFRSLRSSKLLTCSQFSIIW